MDQSDRVVLAAKEAIARVRARGSAEVTPDDLLIGLLRQVSRFGVALVGGLAIDMNDFAEPPDQGAGADVRPAYAAETVRIFERAVTLARQERAALVDLAHLLAAYAFEPTGLFAELATRYGFTPFEWRTALAGWEAAAPDAGAGHERSPSQSDLFTTERAAAFLSVHPQTIRSYIRSVKLPAFRIAGERKIRIRREDLLALLEPVSSEDPDLPA